MRLALLLHDLFVRRVGLGGQTAGQQKIARVAGGHFDDVAAVAQFIDVFSEYDFHGLPFYSEVENGTSAILRACLIDSAKRR